MRTLDRLEKTTWIWIAFPVVACVLMLVALCLDRAVTGGGILVIGMCLMAAWWDPERTRPQRRPARPEATRLAVADDTGSLIDQMVEQGRAPLLLQDRLVKMLDAGQRGKASQALLQCMAEVPAGNVCLVSRAPIGHPDRPREYQVLKVEPFLLDRHAVTNDQFSQFVLAGGYEQATLWDDAVAPGTFDFLDQTGVPAPRFWRDGMYLGGQEDHPVVGICWYEAMAYARWLGKRLPTDPEWVKAASWPVDAGDVPKQRKYPWGDEMGYERTNIWGSEIGHTVPVHDYQEGAAPGGHYQMSGNVWEWTCDNFGQWDSPAAKIRSAVDLKSLRGGAFDTYFDFEATCQFQSGEFSLSRRHNIGFRCAISTCDVGLSDSPNEHRGRA